MSDRYEKLERRVAEIERRLGIKRDRDTVAIASEWPDRPPKRLSRVMPRFGTKRPVVLSLQEMFGTVQTGVFDQTLDTLVCEFQRDHGLDDDGIVGPKTWAALLPDHHSVLFSRIYEWVSWVESGTVHDSFGFAQSDIGDGAGANYGVIQYNSRGSMVRLLNLANRQDLLQLYEKHDKSTVVSEIKVWIGSDDGIQYQMEDFTKTIMGPAIEMFGEIVPSYCGEITAEAERLLCLLADFRVQNGSLYSPYRGPYRDKFIPRFASALDGKIEDPRALAEATLDVFNHTTGDVSYRNKQAIRYMLEFIDRAGTPNDMAIALAVYRGACSRYRYVDAVITRKLAIATGSGVVHGSSISMYDDFGIGIPESE